jgi:hypothetical protein
MQQHETGHDVQKKEPKPQKDRKYYVKDGIRMLKHDLRENLRNLRFNLVDLLASYWELLVLKCKKR